MVWYILNVDYITKIIVRITECISDRNSKKMLSKTALIMIYLRCKETVYQALRL